MTKGKGLIMRVKFFVVPGVSDDCRVIEWSVRGAGVCLPAQARAVIAVVHSAIDMWLLERLRIN